MLGADATVASRWHSQAWLRIVTGPVPLAALFCCHDLLITRAGRNTELFEDVARSYLRTVLPRFDQARWLRVEHATTDRSRFPAWFHPRGLQDLPELANPAASDTAVVTAWWPDTPAERVTLALERHLNQEGAGPRDPELGQDIKVMTPPASARRCSAKPPAASPTPTPRRTTTGTGEYVRSATSAPPPSSSAAPEATRQPDPADMDRVLAQLGYHTPYLIEDGHVWTHGLGEQRRYAIQHTLRNQIWELDQPHYLHAHGRAPHGHAPDPAQARHLTALRDELTTQTPYTDD